MNLGYIAKGAKLIIFEEMQQRAVSDEYEATFRYLENDKNLVVQSSWLYDNYDRLNLGAKLNISFEASPAAMGSFTGVAKEKLRANGLVMIEQISVIEEKSRRKYDRDELRVHVKVYGIPEAKVSSPVFEKPLAAPDLTDTSFDVSSGGLCIITNTLLSSKHDPFYLVEFAFSDKDSFLLPSRIVRKSNYPRTKIGRYDYGFQFIYDNLPEEKSRLTRAILNKKLQHR
ncbi:MAG: PilZ domain-containing protein [Oscillospiraceae bacterium]|nr:PilZ domain-containing protein [Oscillospiraceae bacterium]